MYIQTTGADILYALVETDFDQTFLLHLLAENPQDPLCRKVYEALYSDSRESLPDSVNRPKANIPN